MNKLHNILLSCVILLSTALFTAYVVAAESYLWPAPSTTYITQTYSSGHKAIDIGVSNGSALVASKSGTIFKIFSGCHNYNGAADGNPGCSSSTCSPQAFTYFADFGKNFCNSGYGNGVVIKHTDGTYSSYAHMSTISVSLGSAVIQGQQIGTSGSSGASGGPHLHFSLMDTNYAGFNNNPGEVAYIYSVPPATLPVKPIISFNHVTSAATENIVISWTSSVNNSGAWIAIYDENYHLLHEQSVFGTSSFTTQRSAGTYRVQLDVWNSLGHTPSDVYTFYVANVPRPGKPMVWVTTESNSNKATVNWGTTPNTTWYDVRVYKSNGILYQVVYNVTNLKYAFTLPNGTYYATVAAVNPDYPDYNQFSDHTANFSIAFTPTPTPTRTPTPVPTLDVVSATGNWITPKTDNTFSTSGSISLSVNANDNVRVARVTFHAYYDGVWHDIGNDSHGGNGTYVLAWNFSNIEPQSILLNAHIFDTSGNYTNIQGPIIDIAFLPGKPTLKVTESNRSTEMVVFSWATTPYTTHYDLRILQNGSVIRAIYSISGNTYYIQLPGGSYSAYLCAVNVNHPDWWTAGNTALFTVNTVTPTPVQNSVSTPTATSVISATPTIDSSMSITPNPTIKPTPIIGVTENASPSDGVLPENTGVATISIGPRPSLKPTPIAAPIDMKDPSIPLIAGIGIPVIVACWFIFRKKQRMSR
jgi:murein DD-endopeptidase MepM/ murein hydrolase activator NlpD